MDQEEYSYDGEDGQVQLGPRDPGLRAGVLEHREHQGPLKVNVGSERRRRHLPARVVHRLGRVEDGVMYYYHIVPELVHRRGLGSGHCCAAQWVDVLLYTKMLIMSCTPVRPRALPVMSPEDHGYAPGRMSLPQ